MRRIGLAVAVTLSVTLLPLAVTAQSGAKLPRIGVLTGTVQPPSPRANALLAGLREFGYVDRQTVAIEWRPSGGKTERLPDLAAELVRLNVDVIVASDNPSIVAAQRVTKTIPIVMILASDPVGSRFVASLARPGGNITGLTVQSAELQGKSMQLLKEALPHVSRPAVLWDHSEPERYQIARSAQVAAEALGLRAQLMGAGSLAEIDNAFAAMARERTDAVIVQGSQTIFPNRGRIAELAMKRRLPTMGWSADTVEAGFLMSYGPNFLDLHRRVGYYVDRILKGAKPADLPVEQPTKFELLINMKTANALGLKLPASLRLRADEIIQ